MDESRYCVWWVGIVCDEVGIVCDEVGIVCDKVGIVCDQVGIVCDDLYLTHWYDLKKNRPYSNIFYSILLYTLIYY